MFVTSRPHPESFLPFIGALVGGADTRSSAAVFLFDTHGVLKSASTTTSNVGTGLSTDLHSAPVPGAEPPVLVKSIQPPAVQSIEPLPEEEVQPAPKTVSNCHQNKASSRLRTGSDGPQRFVTNECPLQVDAMGRP
ncbi:hypothetical protein [Paraburkholderia aromaticivorans]|uniref:hypothetical protein n=1 Tax=Paraburkholderia aromaticivorans TaxID=2026199 RepID=UPI001F0FF355|nr:hypothetical protein [Paraburkholderia aromaticivorans]